MVSWEYAFRRGFVIWLWSIVWGIAGSAIALLISGGSLIPIITNPQAFNDPNLIWGPMAGVVVGVILGTLVGTIGFYASFVKIILEETQKQRTMTVA